MSKENNRIEFGSWLSVSNENIAEIFCNHGFSFLVVDMEHSSYSVKEACNLIRIIKLKNKKAYVRLPNIDERLIKNFLEFGADGLIAPMINNLNQVKKLIKYCFHLPLGNRGISLNRSNTYGKNFNKNLKNSTKKIKLFVQIESKEALDNLKAIFSEKLVSGFIIGPYDLSMSLGIPGNFTSKKFLDAEKKIIDEGKKFNKIFGTHLINPSKNEISKAVKKKYKFIACGVDFKIIGDSLKNIF
ncbi:MAG: hypothetical protein CMM90_00305 [Rickettsiales bacterium]|nr:hypothetical protein [Rickettsiales bacterium]